MIELTCDEVQIILHDARVSFDQKLVESSNITGRTFRTCISADLARDVLGITCLGDCARAVEIATSLRKGYGVPVPADITKDGDEAHPTSWGVEQFCGWASKTQLKPIVSLLRSHKFAGDILMTMDVALISYLMNLNVTQKHAFQMEILDLRARERPNRNGNDGLFIFSRCKHLMTYLEAYLIPVDEPIL